MMTCHWPGSSAVWPQSLSVFVCLSHSSGTERRCCSSYWCLSFCTEGKRKSKCDKVHICHLVLLMFYHINGNLTSCQQAGMLSGHRALKILFTNLDIGNWDWAEDAHGPFILIWQHLHEQCNFQDFHYLNSLLCCCLFLSKQTKQIKTKRNSNCWEEPDSRSFFFVFKRYQVSKRYQNEFQRLTVTVELHLSGLDDKNEGCQGKVYLPLVDSEQQH